VYGGLGLFLALYVAAMVGCSIAVVTIFMGDSAWPCGLTIGLLIAALIAMRLQHRSQLAYERERFRDLEESRIEFYS
jgi:uncharacterized membrane protein